MLKRYQVLLADWMAEYIKLIAEKDDISFSEAIRLFLCEGFLRSVPLALPESKSKINTKFLAKLTKEGSNPKASLEKRHKNLSALYFEARKIMEYTTPKLKKIIGRKKSITFST